MSNAVVGAELLVKMAVDYADLKSGMDKATQAVGDAGKGISEAMNIAKQAFVGFVGVASIDAFKSMISGSISAIAKFQDLSETAGVSASSLMALSKVAGMSGVSAETVAGAMNKLNMQLVTQGEDGKTAAAGLKAIGLSYSDFVSLSPDQRMKAIADALAEYRDGSEKSAVAMALFGKAGAELVPMLKDLAEVEQLTAKANDQQIAMAEDYERTLKKLSASGKGWKDELALGMLPALDDAAKAFLAVTNESGGLRDSVKKLSADGTLELWTTTAIKGFTYLLDAAAYVIKIFQSIGTAVNAEVNAAVSFFTGVGDAITKFKDGQYGAAVDAIKGGSRAASLVIQQSNAEIEASWSEPTVGAKIRERMDQTKALREAQAALGDTTEASKPKIDTSVLNKANTAAQDEQTKSLIAMAGKFGALIATQQQELDMGRQLTEGEKLMVEVDKLAAEGKIKLTDQMRSAYFALAAMIDSNKTAIDTQRTFESSNRSLAISIGDQTLKLKEQNDTMLMTSQQVDQYHLKQMQASIDARQNQLDIAKANGLSKENAAILQEVIDKMKALAAEEKRGVAVKAAKDALDAWTKTVEQIENGLTDALMRAFESGKSFMQSFRDTLVAAFKTLVLQPTIKAIFNPIAAGIGSSLGITGAANAATSATRGFNIMSWGSSALSSLSRLGNFTGGFSSTMAGIMGGEAGLTGGLSAGMSALGAGNLMGAAGSLGPYAIAAIAALSIIQSMTSKGGPKVEGGSGFGISSANGWNRGDAASAQALADTIKAQYGTAVAGLGGSATGFDAGVFYAKDPAGTSQTQLNVIAGMNGGYAYERANGGGGFENVGRSDAEFQAAFAEASSRAMLAGLQRSDIDKTLVDYFKKVDANVASAATVSNMIALATQARSMSEAVHDAGSVFGALGKLSVEARNGIVDLTGGLDAFVQKTHDFVKNYYSTAEQNGIAATDVLKTLAAAGIDASSIGSKDDFRRLVDSLDLSTTAGQQQLAALLNVEGEFAGIGDYMRSSGISLSELAKNAPASAVLNQLPDKQQSTTDAVASVGDQIATSNSLLAQIVSAVTSSTSSIVAAVADGARTTSNALLEAGVTK